MTEKEIEGSILVNMRNAAMEAGYALLDLQPSATVVNKEDKDFLTIADVLSEKIIFKTLKAEYPSIPTFSEEDGGEAKTSGYLWVIDPLDGTVSYFHQSRDRWGVSIALVKDGITQIGVVFLPGRGELFEATTSMESMAWKTNQSTILSVGRPIRVNQQKREIDRCHFLMDWGKTNPELFLKRLGNLRAKSLYPATTMCCTSGLIDVAQGYYPGYALIPPDPFDIAAAGLIAEKAGARVTTLDGQRWSPFAKSIVASNDLVHDELLAILNV